VASGNLKVKVLGTRFDVNAYPDDNKIKVTLESGKVELLNSADNSFSYKLNPGEMAEFESQTSRVQIKTVESKNYLNWKDGELTFVDTPMAEVFKSLERKFDIKIEVNNPMVYKSVFNAKFKSESLKEILDYIQFSCPVAYQLVSEKGTIQKKVIFN
jgi:ferric-dicitrate binding protein FerR (iron transport regulator)